MLRNGIVKEKVFCKSLLGMALVALMPSAFALDLMQSYELALKNDPIYRSASKDYEAGAENNGIGRAAVMPKVAAQYNQNANRAVQWGAQYTGGPNTSTNWSYPSNYTYVQLTQPIFSLEAFARWRQGIAQADFSQSKFIFNTQDLLIRVLQAYTDLLFSMDQLQFQVAERDAFYEQYKAAKKLNQGGEASITDMLEAEASYQVADAKVIDAKDAVENARRKLVSVIGEPVDDLEKVNKLSGNFRYLNLPTMRFEEWKDKALSANAELKAAENNVEIAKQEYRKNHAGHYPVVNVIGALKLFPAFAKAAKIDASKVNITNMTPNLREQMLKNGQVDAIFGYINTVWFSAKAVGLDPEKDLRFINYGDHGLDLYSNTIVVSKALAKDNPNAVKGLLKAINRAINDTLANPEMAMDTVLKREPLVKRDVEKERLIATLKEEMSAPEIVKIGLGDVTDERLQKTIDTVFEANALPRKPTKDEIFSRAFLPARADRPSKLAIK